ncbi:MAG TPA: protein kinase, partial [Chloroflexia bacterium]|nr:protein kinase [Chloroflexia bacterium]
MPIPSGFDPSRLLQETIGGYQLKEVLGTGNALVYRAFDPRKGEYVAFKLLSWPGAQVDETTLRRFKREIDLLRRRRHAAIIDIYDWHTAGEYVYMAMECCDGTLEGWLQAQRPSRPKLTDVLRIAEPLAAALDFLHEGEPPVLHRDIKPANILYKGPHWYISDFGIARAEADQLMTSDGTLLGTLRYAAPEQITGGKLSAATDVYSFGLVVYEMLTGGWVLEPRREGGAYEIPPLSRYRRGLGPVVDALFRRWLDPSPAGRPRRAADAVRELAAAAGILRDPALARLYDLATELAARPHSPEAWGAAADLLAAIAWHEPAFSDPRGLTAELRGRQIGTTPGPAPAGYSGDHPPSFYSEPTLAGREPDADAGPPPPEPALPEPPVRKIRPPADLGAQTFAPRSRLEAEGTLVVPADTRLPGSVFGRHVVLEPGARVDGDIYSLGQLTLGSNAEVAGSALASGAVEAGRGSRIGGPGGVQGDMVHLGKATRIGGWATAGAALAAEPGVEAAGVLAQGPVTLAGEARIAATTIGSLGATIDLAGPVLLGDHPAGAESIQAWAPAGPDPGPPPGQVLTSLLTRRGQELVAAALATVDAPAILTPPRPVDGAPALTLQATPATPGPTLYLPAALRPAPDAPAGWLPEDATAWEGPLAGAWMLDGVWRETARRLRLPLACAVLLTLLCTGLAAWLVLTGQAGAAGLLGLGWIAVLAQAAAIFWAWRPRPLELTRLWWAWETWNVAGGVLLWDTLDPGAGPGYREPEHPLAPLVALAAAVVEPDLPDTAILARLTDLCAALEGLAWKSWPGVFV